MPERYLFVELQGLSMGFARCQGSDIDIYILLKEGDADVSSGVTAEAFTLNAVPAINLFHKRCDRLHVSSREVEQHLVVDRTAQLDYEIYALEKVTGIGGEV